MATIALSLVMTSWRGTSSTCSIMLIFWPTRSTNGMITWKPGPMTLRNLPKRSSVNSKPCGTVRNARVAMTISAKTTTKTTDRPSITHPLGKRRDADRSSPTGL